MTRTEMIAFIKANPFIPITHYLFDDSEYIYSTRNGTVLDENGNIFEDWYSPYMCDGIRLRDDVFWQNGWEIKKGIEIYKYKLVIPTVGLCCEAYYLSKGNKGFGQRCWMHFPFCSKENCPLEHPELLKGATLETEE